MIREQEIQESAHRGFSPARLGALIGAGCGLCGLAGWITDAPALRSVVHGWPSVTPLVACALVLCAAAVAAQTFNGDLARGTALAAAGLASLAGAFMLLAIADLVRADRMLLAGSLQQAHESGRPNLCVALAILALAIGLSSRAVRPRLARSLAMISAAALSAGLLASVFGGEWPDPSGGGEAIGILAGLGLAATLAGLLLPATLKLSRSWLTTPMILTSSLVVMTIAGAIAAHDQAYRNATMQRATLATRVRNETIDTLQATIARLRDVAASAAEHWPADQRQFSQVARGLLEDREINGVVLVEIVPGTQRRRFERRYRHTIDFLSPSGSARRAPDSATYFVSRSTVTRVGRISYRWLDISADHERLAALMAAARTGMPRATPPTHLLGGTIPATAIYVPVYRSAASTSGESLSALRGFIASSYRYDLLATVLRKALPAHTRFTLSDGGTKLLADGVPHDQTISKIHVAGRLWVLAVGLPALDQTLLTTVIVIGSLLTFLLGALSLQAARRERYALNLVDRRMAERDRAERALQAAEERFRTAFSEAPIGMVLIEPDGRILQVNDALVTITGYSESQLLSIPYEQLTHPEDRGAESSATRALLCGETRVHDVERRIVHAAGHVVWVAIHSTVVRDDAGEPSYLLAQVEDITARRRYEMRLQHMADHDPLTGLFNRRAFERLLEAHVTRGERYGHEGALIMLDLDDFKQVNDTLGHSAGDELIVKVGHALAHRLRESDTIARLGGDEFAILIPTGGLREAERLADALLETIRAQHAPREPGGRARPISASIGIAAVVADGRVSADELMINADLAMYDAKEAGRDRSESYGGSKQGRARIETRLEWAERIRSALEEDNLVLYAQPVLDTHTGLVSQFELLVRMVVSQGEVISPAVFLPVAEQFGLIRDIDRWVVRKAIAILAEHRGRKPVVEINLSGHSLGDRELAQMISSELTRESVAATQLIFEVTETTAISNIAAAQRFAEQLAQMGCRFALDDFGAGFGSFYYLKHLPFDYIKIDGEFVRNCTENPTDRLVIRAVVDLARGLGKSTIAEFVGDERTLVTLTDLGVDFAQGYHIGRPLPAAQALREQTDDAQMSGSR